MPTKKLPREKTVSANDVLSDDHEFWSRQFLTHLEAFMLDSIRQLSNKATPEEYRAATLHAVIETLVESGLELSEFPDVFATAMSSVEETICLDRKAPIAKTQWTQTMNSRRVELIDKVIQESITIVEQIELAKLTRAMRDVVDSELSLPLDGAKALHQKLLSIQQGESAD